MFADGPVLLSPSWQEYLKTKNIKKYKNITLQILKNACIMYDNTLPFSPSLSPVGARDEMVSQLRAVHFRLDVDGVADNNYDYTFFIDVTSRLLSVKTGNFIIEVVDIERLPKQTHTNILMSKINGLNSITVLMYRSHLEEIAGASCSILDATMSLL